MRNLTLSQSVLLVIAIVVAIIVIVKVMQTLGMEKVRKYVYQLFIEAENKFMHGNNAAKFEYVVTFAKSAVPAPFNMFITESLLRKVIQAWFELVKDLLDDGRFNRTEQ